MNYYFDPYNKAFINDELNIPIEEHFIPIPEHYYKFLIERQGKYCTIESRDNGIPYLKYDDPSNVENSLMGHAIIYIRNKRNSLLSRTDWTQMGDIPDNIKIPYAKYRQKLRDIPQQDTFPHKINWPEEPKKDP